MTFIDHLNLYFGTEFDTVEEFIRDFKQGDLHDDYNTPDDALNHLLMFINSYGRNQETR